MRCASRAAMGSGTSTPDKKPGQAGQDHMDAVKPIGTVQADDEAPGPVEMGVHEHLQRAGIERLAERGHAPDRSGVLSAGAEDRARVPGLKSVAILSGVRRARSSISAAEPLRKTPCRTDG